MGFVHEEEEAVGEERYDSEDSDDDVDRYVFLARDPAPVEASSDGEDDVEGAVVLDGGGGGGGGRGRKRLLRELLDATASPSARKARVDHLTAPSASQASGSEAAESGSEDAVRLPDRGKIENKKRVRCGGGKVLVQRAARGKRSRVPGGEAGGEESHRDGNATTEASRRFLCNLCGRCFGSHHALGGHVRVHRNRAKHDIAGATHEEKTAAALASVVTADSNREGPHGNGDNESEDGVIAASHERTIGNGRDEEEMAIGAARNHVDLNGDGNAEEEEEEEVVAAPSDGYTGGDGAEKKIAVRRCHKLATGNGNKIARKPEHRCEVCGKECLTGQALGGHMRKHRTRPG